MRFAALLAVVLANNSLESLSGGMRAEGKGGVQDSERPAAADKVRTALITFSGLWNGIDPYTNYAVLHRPVPSTYQPLLEAEPSTKPVDGGKLGVRIGWDTAQCSSHGLNSHVMDHTGDVVTNHKLSDHELGGAVMFALGPCALTFSKPIEIPSLFWTFYESTTQRALNYGTIAVFRNVSDTTPLKSVEVPYHDKQGYVWRKLTDFAGLKISKIVFDPRGQGTGLNIDDISVRVSGGN